jgi:acyl dehydratase
MFMAMDLERIRSLRFPAVTQSYTQRDTILYALGLGYGADPLDEEELNFVYEKELRTVPSFCSNLCHPGFWAQDPAYGIDWVKILHAEQAFTIHAPIPPAATLTADLRVAGIEDKGAEKGAMVHQEKRLMAEDGSLIATVRSTLFLRGNGGEGGFGEAIASAPPLPDRPADRQISIPTSSRAALIYRLSGDWNPLHADPDIARRAGFDRPILHGLCTLGIACRAILAGYCGNRPERLKSMFVRFSRPVFPGETIRIETFEEGDELRFRAVAVERDVVVLDRCSALVE